MRLSLRIVVTRPDVPVGFGDHECVAHCRGSVCGLPSDPDGSHDSPALRRHARGQLGLFTQAQAIASGVNERQTKRMVARGHWHEQARFVYRAALAAPPTFEQRLMAVVLSVGGVAYGRSALALYGLIRPPSHPEVLVVRGARNRRRDGIHSTRSLLRNEIVTAAGVPAVLPGRAIIDGAATLRLPEVCRIVDEAVAREIVHPMTLRVRAVELNNAKRPGCAKVLGSLALQHPGLERARSVWEAEVWRLVRRYGLIEPAVNHPVRVGGQRRFLDVAWVEEKVDLEFDGFLARSSRAVFDDDRARQNALVADGWTVFRATSTLLRDAPDQLFSAVRQALVAGGHRRGGIRRVS
jgi:very-short-patch-repair endonuclease